MEKNIYLHIGFHKTATTTIQSGLKINEEQLKNQGWLYPQTTRFNDAAHHNIHFDLKNSASFDPTIGGVEDLTREISHSNAHAVILSSEGLCTLSPPLINRLLKYLSPFGNIHVIAYIREQTEFLQSWYLQNVKGGNFGGSIEDFIEEFSDRANFYQRLKPWIKELSAENIYLKVLEKAQITDHVFYDFLRLCGINSVEKYKIPDSLNISPGIKTIEINRFLTNKLDYSGFSRNKTHMRLVSQAILMYGNHKGWSSEKPNLITPEIHQKIKRRYANDNKKLAKEILKRDHLFIEEYKIRPVTEFDIKTLDPEEMLDLMAFVIKKLGMDK